MSFIQAVNAALHIVIYAAVLVGGVFLLPTTINLIKKNEEEAWGYFATSYQFLLPCAIAIGIMAIFGWW